MKLNLHVADITIITATRMMMTMIPSQNLLTRATGIIATRTKRRVKKDLLPPLRQRMVKQAKQNPTASTSIAKKRRVKKALLLQLRLRMVMQARQNHAASTSTAAKRNQERLLMTRVRLER